MQIYVAGALADAPAVRAAQDQVRAAGHHVVHDWTRASDASLTDYAGAPAAAASIAHADLDAVLAADAVLVLVGEAPGLGMWVELGAALAGASRGGSRVAVVGPDLGGSVFFFHPLVERCTDVAAWLATA